MKIDILAIGAHPDDVELSCSGTMILHKLKGYTTGVLDLTQGELGSRGSVSLRQQESKAASEVMQLDLRENLSFRDGFFQNDEVHQRLLIQAIRKYQPDIILSTASKDRHPDHSRASWLIRDACYLSGLVKIESEFEGRPQEPWRPKKLFNYIQDQYIEPDFIIDISSVIDTKMKSIEAYRSQFKSDENDGPSTYISSENYVEKVKYRNALLGKKIGVKFGEGFLTLHSQLGLKSFDDIILPGIV